MLASSISLFAYSPKVDYASLFSSWKHQHSKSYASIEAESKAFATFSLNEDTIQAHNGRGLSYSLGHNEFSDLTWEEFFHAGIVGQRTGTSKLMHVGSSTEVLADAVDWVAKGAVTAVKNQGTCGSCWSFSASGAIEGAYQIAGNSLTSLSEEDLVQCDTTDNGCGGGLMDNAFTWVKEHGIATESAYPYTSSTGTRGTCSDKKAAKAAVTVTGHVDVATDDESALKSAVAQQPVSVAIEADKSAFQLYKSGVLDSSACGKQLDHGVLVVGYGTDPDTGKDYWKVKNSWGSTWGEEGYIRMVRGSNMCGIASQPSYPTGVTTYTAVEA